VHITDRLPMMVLDMTAPLNTSRSPSPSRARCFCGAPQASEIEYYCSVKCAREDALNALTLGAPHTSDRPPTPPLPTLPPDFFKPPIVRRGSYRSISSNGSDEGFPYHVELGPFAALHPRSKPDVVPRADASTKPGHASCSSSGSDKPRWKSHYRRLREKGSLHSIPDTIQQAFQVASASATDEPIGSSSAASSTSKSKSKLMQKMASGAVRASFRQLAPSAADLDFFDSLPLQNPRKPMSGHLTISSTRVRSTSQQSSTRGAPSALSPIIPPGLDFATQSPASRHRALSSAFGRSEPSLSVRVTAIETPAALHQDLRAPRDASRSTESSTIEFDNAASLECPLPRPPKPKQPIKGGAPRLYLPLRRIDSQCPLSSQKPPQRLPFTTDVGLPPSAPTAVQTSTRPGIVVRQGVQLTKRRLPIGGGPTKFSTDLKSGHSRASRVPIFLQRPVGENEVPKLPPSPVIEVEDAPAFDVNSERPYAPTRQRTMAPAFPKTPSPNMPSPGASSISVTPRPNQFPPLRLEGPEKSVSIVHDDGREMDEVSTPSTSECPVTPADCAFTLGDSQLHPSASVGWSRAKQGMEESDGAIFNLHRRFESGMDLDEVTPIGEKRFVLAAQCQ